MKTKKQYLQELIEENKQNRLQDLKEQRYIIVNQINNMANIHNINCSIMITLGVHSPMFFDSKDSIQIVNAILKQKENELKEVERFIEYLS